MVMVVKIRISVNRTGVSSVEMNRAAGWAGKEEAVAAPSLDGESKDEDMVVAICAAYSCLTLQQPLREGLCL